MLLPVKFDGLGLVVEVLHSFSLGQAWRRVMFNTSVEGTSSTMSSSSAIDPFEGRGGTCIDMLELSSKTCSFCFYVRVTFAGLPGNLVLRRLSLELLADLLGV